MKTTHNEYILKSYNPKSGLIGENSWIFTKLPEVVTENNITDLNNSVIHIGNVFDTILTGDDVFVNVCALMDWLQAVTNDRFYLIDLAQSELVIEASSCCDCDECERKRSEYIEEKDQEWN